MHAAADQLNRLLAVTEGEAEELAAASRPRQAALRPRQAELLLEEVEVEPPAESVPLAEAREAGPP